MKPKNSLLLTTGIFPPDIGGPATQTYYLSKILDKTKVNYKIITYAKINIETNKIIKIKSKQNILIKYFKYFIKVLFIGNKFKIIYCQGIFSEGIPTIFANLFLRKKLILRLGGDFIWEYSINNNLTFDSLEVFLENKQTFKISLLIKIYKFLLKRVEVIIVPTEFYKNILVKYYGIKKEKIIIVRNLFECENKIETKQIKQIKTLLYVGRLIKLKNINLIINAIKDLKGVHLNIVGEGPEENSLKTLVKNLNLEDKVTFLGYKNKQELDFFYSKADLFILLSTTEISPNVLLEAMGYNLIILTTKIGGSFELIKDYNKIFLVESFKLIEITEKILAGIKFKGNKSNSKEILEKHSRKTFTNSILEVLLK